MRSAVANAPSRRPAGASRPRELAVDPGDAAVDGAQARFVARREGLEVEEPLRRGSIAGLGHDGDARTIDALPDERREVDELISVVGAPFHLSRPAETSGYEYWAERTVARSIGRPRAAVRAVVHAWNPRRTPRIPGAE